VRPDESAAAAAMMRMAFSSSRDCPGESRGTTSLRPSRPPFAAGVSLFDLSRLMGTSVEQLDKVYGHLLTDSLDRARGALETYVSTRHAEAGAAR